MSGISRKIKEETNRHMKPGERKVAKRKPAPPDYPMVIPDIGEPLNESMMGIEVVTDAVEGLGSIGTPAWFADGPILQVPSPTYA
jgi:hypothetical protein